MIRIQEAVSQGEVDHDQSTVGFPLSQVGLDAVQRLLDRNQQKFVHLNKKKTGVN